MGHGYTRIAIGRADPGISDALRFTSIVMGMCVMASILLGLVVWILGRVDASAS